MEEISGTDRVNTKCYIQCDVTPCVFYLPKMLVFFSLQRATSVQLSEFSSEPLRERRAQNVLY